MTATHRNLKRLGYDLKNMVQDLDQLIKGIPEDLGDEARRTRDRLQTTLDSAKDLSLSLEKKALAGVETTDVFVHDHPYPILGVALGVGLIVGCLLCRRDWLSL